jgi:hypothetical protein
MKHRVLTAFAFTTVIAAAGIWVGGSAQADDAKPCVNTKFKFPKVKEACDSGGQKAAKALMKKAVKKMKADGKDVNCKSCHTELKTYKNKDNANKDLKGYL